MTFHRPNHALKISTQLTQSIVMMLESQGLFVRVGNDIKDWGDMMRAAEERPIVNQAFDPDYCDLDSSNSFWLAITDQHDTTLGCIAAKKLTTTNLAQEIRAGSIWLGRTTDPNNLADVALPATVPLISGTVAFHGGFWLDPNIRGLGLARLVPRMARAIGMRRFGADWNCGFVFAALGEAGVPKKAYGYSHCELAVDGWYPPMNRHDKLYLPWESRAEWVEASINWMHARVDPGNQQFVHDVAFGGQWQDEPVTIANATLGHGV